MKKIVKLVSAISLIIHTELLAQDRGEILSANSTFYNIQNGINPNLYTGSLAFNIPLISIPLKESNQLKVDLNYSSKPFNPSEMPNEVGLNWNLNDDYYIVTGGNFKTDFNTTNDIIDDNVNNLNTFELDYDNPTMYNYYGGYEHYYKNTFFQRQVNPHRKYYFKINDIRGYFIVDNYGIPVVYAGNHNIKVDLSNYGNRSYNSIKQNGCNVGNSKITLTDDKGNIYIFGGDDNSLETTYTNTASSVYAPDAAFVSYHSNIYISGWKISKIQYTTGDTLEYSYKDINKQNTYQDFCSDSNIIIMGTIPATLPQLNTLNQKNMYVQRRKAVTVTTDASTDDTYETTFDWLQNDQPSEIDVKKSVLEKIKINNAYELKYSYIRSDNPEESSLVYISNIALYNSSQKINDISLEYTSLGTNQKRTFLNKITLNNIEKYEMDYYNTNNFPSYFEIDNTDLLGLYARNRTTVPISASVSVNKAKSYPEDFDIGLLRSVIFPNKGKNTFEYERGNYSKVYSADPSVSPYLNTFNRIGTANIPRIKKINWYSNDNNLLYKKYFDYNINGVSTGTLNLTTIGLMVAGNHLSFFIPQDGTYRNDRLTYDNVKEYDDKGSIISQFTDYKTNPNFSLAKAYNTQTGQWNIFTDLSIQNYNISQDRSMERGLMIGQKIYDKNNNLLKEITNHFDRKKLASRLISESPIFCESWINGTCYNQRLNPIMNIYKEFFYLSSQEVAEYFNGKKIEQKNKFIYDTSNYYNLISQETTSSDGNVIKKNNLYAFEKNNQKLINANIVAVPLEFSMLQNGILNKKMETKYDDSNSLFPTSALTYNIGNGNISSSTTYDKYDNKGNLLQYTSNTGIPTTIIFGYHQTQPIAKIEGANYAQVMAAFGLNGNDNASYLQLEIVKKSDLDIDDTSENTLISNQTIFRSNPAFLGYNITTYTYDPLMGVKSITPASGLRENYFYDTSNRLEKIVNTEGKIIKEFKYNHAPTIYYNNEVSQNFMTNNCGPGTLPVSGIYTVPVGQYSSTISQTDADQKAKNDINLNGQSYVNSHVNCTPYTCSVTPTYLADIYYSSFQEISAGHIKGILSLPLTNTSGGAAPNWSNGVFIGTLGTLCRPSSYKSVNVSSTNGSWVISISQNGAITLRSTGGSSVAITTFYFEFDKN